MNCILVSKEGPNVYGHKDQNILICYTAGVMQSLRVLDLAFPCEIYSMPSTVTKNHFGMSSLEQKTGL